MVRPHSVVGERRTGLWQRTWKSPSGAQEGQPGDSPTWSWSWSQLLGMRSSACCGAREKPGSAFAMVMEWCSCGQCDVVTPRWKDVARFFMTCSEHHAAGVMQM